jgi:diguanylate cyclase (GGDEF)-like protein
LQDSKLAGPFLRWLAALIAERCRRAVRGPLSLRARMGATLAVLVFVVTGVTGAVIGQSSVAELRARIGQSVVTDAGRIAERLSREFGARARELTLLAALDPLHTLRGPGAAQAVLMRLKRGAPAYLWLGITDTQNQVVAATDPNWVGRSFDPRVAIREVTASLDEAARGGPAAGAEPEELRPITLAFPIRGADGSVPGQVVAQLTWDWVPQAEQALLTQEGGAASRQAFLVGFRNTVLSGPAPWPGRRLDLPSLARARAGFTGWAVEPWANEQDYLTGTALVAGDTEAGLPDLRWAVVVREPLASAFAPARELQHDIQILGLVLALLFALAGWLVSGRVIAPLRRLTLAADRLRQGDDIELPRFSGPLEIAMLARSLRALVATLTSQEMALGEMEALAHHDPLTSLPNRLGLQSWLRRRRRGAGRAEDRLLVLVGDLDGFKPVNDGFGHLVGDRLLQAVALRLSEALRPSDIVARLGGDEFVVVLEAPAGRVDEAALSVVRRLSERVGAPYQIDGQVLHVGFSLGVAAWPEDAATLPGALELADAALYTAKRGGKGRVVFHGAASPA